MGLYEVVWNIYIYIYIYVWTYIIIYIYIHMWRSPPEPKLERAGFRAAQVSVCMLGVAKMAGFIVMAACAFANCK